VAGTVSSPRSSGPRIAIACSGLGHVHRGIESWACDLAQGLARAGTDVTLFGGRTRGSIHGLPTLRRGEAAGRLLGALLRNLGGWRVGLGSAYDLEQASFAVALLWHIRRGYDIVHVQDPRLAWLLEAAHRHGWSCARVIYANGTNEPVSFARRFSYLQILTPQLAQAFAPPVFSAAGLFVIPNFVDTAAFTPGDHADARAELNLPQDGTIILCCAAIRRFHKRIDQLAREFALSGLADQGAILVVAGAREADTDAVIAEAQALLGDKVRFLVDVPRERMPRLYQAADAFVLASEHEMFGIVLIEAMACGLPVICNDTEGFRYVVGSAGLYCDLMQSGGIAAALRSMWQSDTRCRLAGNARRHVEERFSVAAVVGRVCAMYRDVAGG
jgi:glycosyltransferase involved in cell wall biosynthesis